MKVLQVVRLVDAGQVCQICHRCREVNDIELMRFDISIRNRYLRSFVVQLLQVDQFLPNEPEGRIRRSDAFTVLKVDSGMPSSLQGP